MLFSNGSYIALKTVLLISFIFFQRGFVLIGEMFKNYLLKIITIILIGLEILLSVYDVTSLFHSGIERDAFLFGAAITYGAIGIVFGVALRRLEKPIGKVAELAGLFQIVAACFFLTVVLSFIGFIFLIPVELLQIIIIFKVIEIIRDKEREAETTVSAME